MSTNLDFSSVAGLLAQEFFGTGRNSASSSESAHVYVDMYQDSDIIYIHVDIPGVNKKDIDIDVFNNKVTIKGTRTQPHQSVKNGRVNQVIYGKFQRTITLPISVTNKKTISVEYVNGVLTLKINKNVEKENKFNIKLTDESDDEVDELVVDKVD